MSNGHTNRGRNNNTVNGNKASRSRRASPNQRNPQSQSVGPHRAQIAPVPAPLRISEISTGAPQDGFDYDRPDPQAESYIDPIAAGLPVADERRTEIPSSKLPAGRGPVVNSIRAPFSPGQGHLQSASNLRGPIPAPRASGSLEPDTPAWNASAAQPASERAADFWRSHEEVGNRDVRGEIGQLIDSLHELFERDRGIASQSDTTRCGICYLHFYAAELRYREEEGFYVCPSCDRALAHSRLVMIRRQQHV
jgi:hypothetical protein